MPIQLSDCCKAPIDTYPKLPRPDCHRCSVCDRVIGSPLNTMPRDYQEVAHKILANLELVLITKSIDGSDIADIWERFKPRLELILTTYGNALELQGVEKVEKGILIENADVVAPPENAKDFMVDWERGVVTGGYTVKIRTLDHIAKIKSELK